MYTTRLVRIRNKITLHGVNTQYIDIYWKQGDTKNNPENINLHNKPRSGGLKK